MSTERKRYRVVTDGVRYKVQGSQYVGWTRWTRREVWNDCGISYFIARYYTDICKAQADCDRWNREAAARHDWAPVTQGAEREEGAKA